MIPRLLACAAAAGLMSLGAGVAHAQNYPNKPIRIVAPEAGGNGDFNARLVALGLAAGLGQSVIVENRAGSVAIPAQTVLNAAADGYTLLLLGTNFWVAPLLQNLPYDPIRDFTPITLATISPNVLVLNPAVPAKSVKELIALAKAKPGELNYGASGTGSPQHMAAELFKAMAGVNIVHVPFKGGGPSVLALLGGQIQVMFASASSVAPHIKSGKLHAVAVTTAEPSALVPGLPTVAASGLPGYESASIIGIFAPARTPAAIVRRLNQEILAVLHKPEYRERFIGSGVEPIGSPAERLAEVMKSEMARLGKVIKDAGIKAE